MADPRRIDITEFATLHLRQKPGTDIALLNGLMYIILEKGWEDKAFIEERTEGFDEFKATVMQYPPEKVARDHRRAGRAAVPGRRDSWRRTNRWR